MTRRFSGASYDRKKDKYKGRITFNGVRYESKWMNTKEEAEEWYLEKSIELHKADVVHELVPEDVLDDSTLDEINSGVSKYKWK